MKFSEKEIVIGIIFLIILGALSLNLILTKPIESKFCGDGICSDNEINSCKLDCSWCGDGSCNANECNSGCTEDCSFSQCENRICEFEKGENCINTPNDCKCVGGYCNTETAQCNYQSCGNEICNDGENFLSCPNDCKGETYQAEDTSNLNYPIIFVHGHSVFGKESEYSMRAFAEMQDKLESDGLYEDRGYILANSEKNEFQEGQWANTEKPISLRTTYYLGEYSSITDSVAQDDNYPISEYSKRLSKVIDNVLYATGKNKVIIIAHSMGGLVAREYIKDYGGINKVDKLIEIGSPNHGIYGFLIGDLCGVHPGQECKDMQYDSSFIANLNSGDETPGSIKYLTIAGSCDNNGEDYHDEVIRVSSVKLDGATNKIISRNECIFGRDTFHEYLNKPSKVPEVYNEIITFI